MNQWNHSLIEEIYQKKISEKSEDRDNLLKLTSHRLYGEKIHYALELIQNADDEEASSITFIFDKDKVTVINDGKPFDEDDVWAICSVKPGRKRNKIGFFGIGFKSVFNITNAPQIISGQYNFRIKDYIYPEPSSSLPPEIKKCYTQDQGAIFILPYVDGLANPSELIESFSQMDNKILLFLKSVSELNFIDNVNKQKWSIKKKSVNESIIALENTKDEQETRWRIFSRDLEVKDKDLIPEGKEGVTDTRAIIAFPCDEATRTVAKQGVIYCYLPTKRLTDLPFLIQADFLPTIGRENISDDDWNLWLLENLGNLAGDALDQIKSDPVLSQPFYEFVPLKEEIKDDLIMRLGNTLYDILRKKKVAFTNRGHWVETSSCAIPDDERIRSILLEKDIESIAERKLYYSDTSLSKRAEKILLDLGAHTVGIKQVIRFLKDEQAVSRRQKKWFLDLCEYLSAVFDTSKKSYWGDFRWDWDEETKNLFVELQELKFILTDDDRLVALKDAAVPDRLICYPQNIDLAEVHQLFVEGEIVFINRYFQESGILHRKGSDPETEEKRHKVKEFFDEIGVKKYFKQAHIISDVILPKFTSGKYQEYDDRKIYALVNYIRMYWSTIESEIRNKKLSSSFIQDVKDRLLLKGYTYRDGKRSECYKQASNLYFSKAYGKNEVMEDLFDGVEGIYFLSPYYFYREKRERRKKKRGRQRAEYSWKKFFETLGVWSSPRVTRNPAWVSIAGKAEYEWIKKQYSPSGVHEVAGNSFSEDLRHLIEYCSKLQNHELSIQRMTLLWECLESNCKLYQEFCKTKYKYFYYSDQYVDYSTSSFLEFLRNSKWVPSVEGVFSRPRELFVDTRSNRFLLGNSANYVNLKGSPTFLKDLEVRTQPTVEEVLEHLRAFREENARPEKSKIEKCSEIYTFLWVQLNKIEDDETRKSKLAEVGRAFNDLALLYLPRKDKPWWKPSLVFWKDQSELFGPLRGYIEHDREEFYNVSLRDFLFSLGVSERASIRHCLNALSELKTTGNLDEFKAVAAKVYHYINDILAIGYSEEVDWAKPVFLSTRGEFLPPSKLYYADAGDYAKLFGSEANILWLPYAWTAVARFLSGASFSSMSEHIKVTKKFREISEMDGSHVSRFINLLSYVEPYLAKKNPSVYESLKAKGVFLELRDMEIFEATTLKLDYALAGRDGTGVSVNGMEREAFFSQDENRLYLKTGSDLFSTDVAKEVSRIFRGGEEDTFPFLDSLLACGSDENRLEAKLEHFGIAISPEVPSLKPTSIEVVSLEPDKTVEPETDAGTRKAEDTSRRETTTASTPELPVQPKIVTGLIDVNAYIPDTLKELVPFTRSDGATGLVTSKEIKLREPSRPGGTVPEHKPTLVPGHLDVEAAAHALAIRIEEFEGREAEDRHDQRGIGYDIFSRDTATNMERFIEVKGFRGEGGSITMTAHEWKKAEQEGDRYYLYILTGLQENSTPQLSVIQNPVKYLSPDPPTEKKVSDWKNGVQKMISFRKV